MFRIDQAMSNRPANKGSHPVSEPARSGYIIDCIGGEQVLATPEEVDAVQVFALRLIQDYGYPKSYLFSAPRTSPPAAT